MSAAPEAPLPRRPVAVCVTGLGVGLPRNRVASTTFDQQLGKALGWIERHSGVALRHVAQTDEPQEVLAATAARAALADAGLSADQLDLILFAAAVGRQPIPATAPLIKQELGVHDLPFPAFDINATCLSTLAAMDVAGLYLGADRARRVLVVSAEIASRALPWPTDPATAALFGDGAAALVLEARALDQAPMRLAGFLMETYATGYELCQLAAGGTRFDYHNDPAGFAAHARFQMDGAGLYRLSAAQAPGFIDRLLAGAGWTQESVDLVVPHQASPHALAHIIKRCGFSADKVIDIVKSHGNQIAASLPIALAHARDTGRLEAGMRVMLIGTAAGVSLGGACLVV